MRPLKVYLCDLTHDTIVLVSDTIPLNIGYVGAYCKKVHGENVSLKLFKYPQQAIDAIKADPPDILGLSNYSWNSNLSERMAAFAKQASPETVTVQGGTNFSDENDQQLRFLLTRLATDFHIDLEGELSFSNLVSRVLAARDGEQELFDGAIEGCVYIQPETRGEAEPILVRGSRPARIKSLDDIPSPYLTGLLDPFFDGNLRPFLETNRGCPFKCSFCHTGSEYFQKTNMYSIDRIREEIEYIAPRISKLGIAGLHIADTNFGMYPRDRDICEALKEAHDTHGWPKQVIATTGKNNKERVIDITGIMGNTFNVNMSVQTMSPEVLKNINRSNIKLDDYIDINNHLREQGRPGFGELILGLPGETRESFVTGLKQVIEAGVSATTVYTLMLLHGTDFQKPDYREQFRIKGRFRIVPLNFGEYEGMRVFDYEEVGVETKDMPFADYKYLRGVSLMVETLHNGRPFEEHFRYAKSMGENRSDMLVRVFEALAQAPEKLRKIVESFMAETESELWENEEEMLEFYRQDDNYQLLMRGEAGGNLIQKYKSLSLCTAVDEWTQFLSKVCLDIAFEKQTSQEALAAARDEVQVLSEFCRKKLDGLLNPEGNVMPVEMESYYDVTGWLQAEEDTPLDNFKTIQPINYGFKYTPDQLQIQKEYFTRYGTDVNALSKIVTRISSLESMIRKINTPEGEQVIYADADRDRSMRYAMAT